MLVTWFFPESFIGRIGSVLLGRGNITGQLAPCSNSKDKGSGTVFGISNERNTSKTNKHMNTAHVPNWLISLSGRLFCSAQICLKGTDLIVCFCSPLFLLFLSHCQLFVCPFRILKRRSKMWSFGAMRFLH